MKKFKLNIILLIFCTILSCGFVYSEPAAQNPVPQQQTTVQEQQPQAEEIPETIPEKNYENLMKIKDTAANSKNFNFFIWIVSIIIILSGAFGIYKIYRKWTDRRYITSAPPKETLATPKDFKTAINLFLGKTDE